MTINLNVIPIILSLDVTRGIKSCTVLIFLQKNFHIIDHEHARQARLANLPRVQELELLRTFVEIVAQRYAISPLLDLSRFRPQFQVHWVTSFQHFAKC